MFLWKKHGSSPTFSAFPEDFDETYKAGLLAVGSPATVRERLESEISQSGANYLLCRFAFGDLTLAESQQSIDLFAAEVMPHFTQAVTTP
jgi:alkanesulfonate monooxygenase SsuD/methylene tetrahydromethanopterin reductase-like flavin-dependent oxidoreductase (luciferase family)